MAADRDRRKFIKAGIAAAAGIGFLPQAGRLAGIEELFAGVTRNTMPKRKLGKTGFNVSLFSLGSGSRTAQVGKEKDSTEVISRALDLGVNYIDTAPSYGNGTSESNIGVVMKERRGEVFLATKTNDRSYDGTLRLFEQSLNRLQTDYIDVYQVHGVRTDDDIKNALSRNGAVRAMERLRDEGAIRYIGITGHRDPDVLQRGISEYEFDTVLMTLNAADIHYVPFQKELLQTAVEKDVGIIAMKVTAQGRIFRENGISSMSEALGYVFSFPVSTANVGIQTIDELEENVRIAREFNDFSRQKLAELEELTESYHRELNFFKIEW
jgi:uncharacterized protein